MQIEGRFPLLDASAAVGLWEVSAVHHMGRGFLVIWECSSDGENLGVEEGFLIRRLEHLS